MPSLEIPKPGVALEGGSVVTGADGSAEISFTKAYSTKPKLACVPELPFATDAISVQVDSWTQDVEGRYIGCKIFATDDGGKGEADVLVLWAVVSE